MKYIYNNLFKYIGLHIDLGEGVGVGVCVACKHRHTKNSWKSLKIETTTNISLKWKTQLFIQGKKKGNK